MALIVHDNLGNSWSISVDATTGGLVTTEVAPANITPGDNPACSLTVQQVVNWARTQTKLIPLIGVGGLSGIGGGQNEPALSIANNVLAEILAPPFNWKFNRVAALPPTPTFVTTSYVQDYQAASVDSAQIGWIESAICEYNVSSQPVPARTPLTVVKDLEVTSDYGNPEKIAFYFDANFNVWYRLWPIPTTQVWNIYVNYQVKRPVIYTLSSTWAPVPDQMDYVIRQGFLAFTKRHFGDPSWIQEYQLFQKMIAESLGTNDAEFTDHGFYPNSPILIG